MREIGVVMNGEELARMESNLEKYDGDDKVVSSRELYEKVSKEVESRPNVQLMSGIPSLDESLKGFRGGEVNVFSGPTGHGKTLLSETLTHNFALSGKNTLWFTYEVPPEQFFGQFDGLPLFYLPSMLKGSDMNWVHKRIWEAKIKYNIQAVFLDHLHYLVPMGNNMSINIGFVMRKLKVMAIQFNISIFLIAHLMKINLESEPELHDIRDSSFVGQEADNVLFIWRNISNNMSTIKISKNRRYGVMNKKIKMFKAEKYLKEVGKWKM